MVGGAAWTSSRSSTGTTSGPQGTAHGHPIRPAACRNTATTSQRTSPSSASTAATLPRQATTRPEAARSTAASSPPGSPASARVDDDRRDGGPAEDLTVAELILAYIRFADGYYRKDGRPTTESRNIRLALRPLRRLYGPTPARDFGPKALKAVRQAMIEAGLCRERGQQAGPPDRPGVQVGRRERAGPPAVHHGLKAVSGLRKGRSEARESEPVKPVPEALRRGRPAPRLPPGLGDDRAAAADRDAAGRGRRSCGPATSTRRARSGPTRPGPHKTEHHGQRAGHLPRAPGPGGPQALAAGGPAAYLFSPAEAMEEHWPSRRATARRR